MLPQLFACCNSSFNVFGPDCRYVYARHAMRLFGAIIEDYWHPSSNRLGFRGLQLIDDGSGEVGEVYILILWCCPLGCGTYNDCQTRSLQHNYCSSPPKNVCI
jgi:hypothetical protein